MTVWEKPEEIIKTNKTIFLIISLPEIKCILKPDIFMPIVIFCIFMFQDGTGQNKFTFLIHLLKYPTSHNILRV
jgi:hypothetical protein